MMDLCPIHGTRHIFCLEFILFHDVVVLIQTLVNIKMRNNFENH